MTSSYCRCKDDADDDPAAARLLLLPLLPPPPPLTPTSTPPLPEEPPDELLGLVDDDGGRLAAVAAAWANSIATCRIASARSCVRSAASYASAASSKNPDPRRSAGELARCATADLDKLDGREEDGGTPWCKKVAAVREAAVLVLVATSKLEEEDIPRSREVADATDGDGWCVVNTDAAVDVVDIISCESASAS